MKRSPRAQEEIKSSKHIYSHPFAQNKECSFSVKIVIFDKDVNEKCFASLFVQRILFEELDVFFDAKRSEEEKTVEDE